MPQTARTSTTNPTTTAAVTAAASSPSVDLEGLVLMLARRVDDLTAQVQRQLKVSEEMLSRLTDASHATKKEAAKLLGVTVRQIDRLIQDGTFTLETIPGTRVHGIAMSALRGWVPVGAIRTAKRRQQR